MTRTRSLLPSSYRSLLAAVALATGVAACGGDDDGSRSTTSSLSAAESDGPAPPADDVYVSVVTISAIGFTLDRTFLIARRRLLTWSEGESL